MESLTYFIVIIFIVFGFILYNIFLYRRLFLNFSDGISIIKKEKVISCNSTLLKLFGYTNKKNFLDIHPLKLSPAYQPDGSFSLTKAQKVFHLAKESGKTTFDWVFLDRNGDNKWIEITILKMNYFGSEIYFMIWKNINQRKQIEEDLKSLNENLEAIVDKKSKELSERDHMLFIQSKQAQMGEMISMIAHQWRQPLASISATVIDLKMKIYFAKMNKIENNDSDFIDYTDEQLNDIETYTQNLTAIIDDFRDFYKPQNQKICNLINHTILKSYNIIKGSLSSKDINVDMKFDSKENIEHYESEIIHVMLNLFNNAMENFEEKNIEEKTIYVETKDTLAGVVISFCDTGGGIQDENLTKIFSPYFTTKENGLGTGLGLYMSKKILMEHHNGDISGYNSEFGACFTIEIKK
jgi:two-component system sensor histidine kinase EvgS